MDQRFYDAVAEELKSGSIRAGLWTRAIAETGNEGDRAKAAYITLRARELVQNELDQMAQMERAAKAQAEEKARSEFEQRQRTLAASTKILPYKADTPIIIVAIFLFVLGALILISRS